MTRLAIYDMDKTITRAPTWTPFLLHAARTVAPWRLGLVPAGVLVTLPYLAKWISRGQLKQAMQWLMLGGRVPEARMQALAASFADAVLANGVFEGARRRIAQDRADGYRLVLATASFHFYAAEIGARLGFDDVIATRSQRHAGGHILSRIKGENCYGPAKLRMVQDWLETQGIARDAAEIRFYSDHVSDAPVLEWADEAFAVNAHAPLRALAKARGWTVLDWED